MFCALYCELKFIQKLNFTLFRAKSGLEGIFCWFEKEKKEKKEVKIVCRVLQVLKASREVLVYVYIAA